MVEAASALFARQGVQPTTIAEITEEADVGFGSFYNHFDSKGAILEAVVENALASQIPRLHARQKGVTDAAELFSIGNRHFVHLAESDPTLAWLVVRLAQPYEAMNSALHDSAMADVQTALEAGRFNVANPELAVQATGGALLAVMYRVLSGEAGPDADIHHAEGVLRAMGLPLDEAAEIARRPLPEL